jgi:hypothetical protein
MGSIKKQLSLTTMVNQGIENQQKNVSWPLIIHPSWHAGETGIQIT